MKTTQTNDDTKKGTIPEVRATPKIKMTTEMRMNLKIKTTGWMEGRFSQKAGFCQLCYKSDPPKVPALGLTS